MASSTVTAHMDASQGKRQRHGAGETTSRIQICSQCHGTSGIDHPVRGHRGSFNAKAVSGRSVATTPLRAIASIPASEACNKWSAETAPNSAASSAPRKRSRRHEVSVKARNLWRLSANDVTVQRKRHPLHKTHRKTRPMNRAE